MYIIWVYVEGYTPHGYRVSNNIIIIVNIIIVIRSGQSGGSVISAVGDVMADVAVVGG